MSYNVVITQDAQDEVRGIFEYIAFNLLVPDTAKKQTRRIIDAIHSLSEFPERNAVYEMEPWKSRGLRKLIIDNYIAFYIINENQKEVVVLHVFYGGRDIGKLL